MAWQFESAVNVISYRPKPLLPPAGPNPRRWSQLRGGGNARLHGDLLPLFRISQLFGVEDAEQDPNKAPP